MDVRRALLSHPQVSSAEVVDLPDVSARPVAFVVADGFVTGPQLRQHLAAALGPDGSPDVIALVPEIDLAAARDQLTELPAVYRFVPPRSAVERWLAGRWADLFGDPGLGVRDDFLELGGDSVSAISTLTEIQAAYGVEISIADFFEHATIEQLAALVESARLIRWPPCHHRWTSIRSPTPRNGCGSSAGSTPPTRPTT